MEISNKIIALLIIIFLILFWYVKRSKEDVARYKNIIDNYISKNEKKISKKVRFDISDNK